MRRCGRVVGVCVQQACTSTGGGALSVRSAGLRPVQGAFAAARLRQRQGPWRRSLNLWSRQEASTSTPSSSSATEGPSSEATAEAIDVATVVAAKAASKAASKAATNAAVTAASKEAAKVGAQVASDIVRNSGSVARDHLANERTFLAWARTGMAFVALGVGISSVQSVLNVQPNGVTTISRALSPVSVEGIEAVVFSPMGPSVLCVATGGLFLVYATHRFYTVQHHLQQGSFPLNRLGVASVIAGTALLTAGSLALLFASGQPFVVQWIKQAVKTQPSEPDAPQASSS